MIRWNPLFFLHETSSFKGIFYGFVILSFDMYIVAFICNWFPLLRLLRLLFYFSVIVCIQMNAYEIAFLHDTPKMCGRAATPPQWIQFDSVHKYWISDLIWHSTKWWQWHLHLRKVCLFIYLSFDLVNLMVLLFIAHTFESTYISYDEPYIMAHYICTINFGSQSRECGHGQNNRYLLTCPQTIYVLQYWWTFVIICNVESGRGEEIERERESNIEWRT